MYKDPKIKAFIEQIESGNINTNELKILNFLHSRPNGSNIEHMRSILNLPHQTLTSRLSILEDYGYIYREVMSSGERHSTYKFEVSEAMQSERARYRKHTKFMRWAKQGVREYEDYMTHEMATELKESIT